MLFKNLIPVMEKRVNGEISREDFYKWCARNMNIKQYVGITDQYAVISKLFIIYNSRLQEVRTLQSDSVYMFFDYELYSLFYILFAFTDITDFEVDISSENYDLIMKSGFFKFINIMADNQYFDMRKKCDKVFGIDTFSLSSQLGAISKDLPTQDDARNIADIINNIDVDKLKNLQEISAMNNPLVNKIVSKLQYEALHDKDKKKKIK